MAPIFFALATRQNLPDAAAKLDVPGPEQQLLVLRFRIAKLRIDSARVPAVFMRALSPRSPRGLIRTCPTACSLPDCFTKRTPFWKDAPHSPISTSEWVRHCCRPKVTG